MRRCMYAIIFSAMVLTSIRASGESNSESPSPYIGTGNAVSEDRLKEFREKVDRLGVGALRSAIEDLTSTYGENYPQGDLYLERLDRLTKEISEVENRTAQGDDSAPEAGLKLIEEASRLSRECLTANPLVGGSPILYVSRRQYRTDHHNTETMFQTGEINTGSFEGGTALKVVDPAGGWMVKTPLEVPQGVIRDPDVHFNGGKIVFSMRNSIQDDYHIYEINVGDLGVKQLTFGSGLSDIDPFYLPDDGIAFTSTREPKYCMCNRHIMGNLFRMDSDGANVHQIGKNTLHEGHGSVTPDGRILYDRWEYVDRNFGDAQGLWTVNPDGTNHAVYWGNNTNSPGAVIDARIVPGTERVLCIFGSCHDLPWGSLTIVDRRLGLDGRTPVVRTWPPEAINQTGIGDFDAFSRFNPKYEDPYPLNDKYFLCSRMNDSGGEMGIYLVDVFGNELLLHAESPGCFDPIPLGPRVRPPVVPSRRDFRNETGTFYVANAYKGTHNAGVKPGSIKYLRIVESPEKRYWTQPSWGGQGQEAPAMNWHSFENKRILGTVPVEDDGSAYFQVPSDKFVYFQMLDERGMMIQSMRSGTMIQSGEVQGCVGCHENRRSAPVLAVNGEIPRALLRRPSESEGWYGPLREFSYMAEVQPVFDRYCVSCHDYGKDAGRKLNLAGDRDLVFNTSYNELWRKGYIRAIGAGPSETQQAYSWGSHASKIVEKILEGHVEGGLDKESFDRIVTWIDINGVYYPTYASAYPDNLAGRSPLDTRRLNRLRQLTGVPFQDLASFDKDNGPQVSFERPELSPCLSSITDKKSSEYMEALAIIEEGQEALKNKPRADMENFRACPVDLARDEKYVERRRIEEFNRSAIRDGQRNYDHGE